ncbi:MAG: ATP-binding protein [Algoriphagus sp.]|uniref:ATP-binding protein n=1 Tax=Algoriphagus sp. TaxID=1872435 RepID=UPI002731220A|nr:ATP-binding protein [Algoriphagus sp.]MDP2043183.1 ATP-binding protein [Algoriphagus sp.]MDP3474000.1 ATP-binding protein [Algoriphagus sp.]
MALTNDQLALARSIYEKYWESYIQGNFEIFCSTLDEDFEMIGTSESEVAHSKSEGIEFYKAQMAEVVGKAEMRNRKISAKPLDDMVLINESCDIYVLAEPEWMFYSKIRISTLLHETNTGWKVIQQHGSLPDMRVQDGETLALEKITRENLELRDAVKRRTVELEQKNRELEIEAALERVRTVAMGMKKPEDMLDVCRIISEQLRQFGVEKIRNIQTAIIDEEKGIYLCYQYFTPYDKEAVERTEYLKSPVEHGMVRQMLASKDGHFTGTLSGRELEEFREHRKAEEHFPDPILDESKEISHCFLSIGEGGLGLTLYQPMDTSTLELFKRFHQVFSLAYSRFQDIQKAETRAREVEIELALERVRAQTMAMHNSEDVGNCVVKMFAELTALGVDEGTRFGIGILNHDNENNQLWTARKDGEEVNMHIGNLDMSWHPLLKSAREAWKAQVPIHKYVLEGEDLLDYYRMLNTAPDYKIQIPIEKLPKKEIQHCFIFEHGFFYAFTPYEFQPELIQITKRFGSLFEQTYRRYLDLVKAEAQAREAQVETALERVRGKAMAMHESQELSSVVHELRKQMGMLGQKDLDTCVIHLLEESPDFIYGWAALRPPDSEEEIMVSTAGIPKKGLLIIEEELQAYYSKRGDYVLINEGEKIRQWYEFIQKVAPEVLDVIEQSERIEASEEHRAYWSFADFSGGSLLMVTVEQPEVSSRKLLRRFANVFGLAYRRFADLKQAEAQAREAQIEAALERVRSRSLAMHKSEELPEVIQLVFEQLRQLNFNIDSAQFDVNFRESDDINIWTAVPGQPYPTRQQIPYFNNPVFNSVKYAKEAGLTLSADNFTFEEKNEFFNYFFKHTNVPEERRKFVLSAPTWSRLVVYLDRIYLGIQNYSGVQYSEAEHAVLFRFAKVFEQTYTRFLDLQKAEAQAREAQIENALEKVRSRSLAMHKSGELNEVVMELFERLNDLQIPVTAVGISINIEDSKDLDNYTCGLVESGIAINNYRLPYFDHRIANDFFEAREKQLDFFVGNYSKQEKDSFYEYVINHTELKNELTEDIKQFIFQSPSYSISVVTTKNTMITLNDFEGKSLSVDEIDILKRFAKVFEQTYTRFLDLQKAEAQAREAQIEAALERVRSRSLAMHKTSELQSVIHTVHQELLNLNISISGGSFIVINSEIDNELRCWGSGGTADTSDEVHIPRFDKPFYTHLLEGIKNGPGFFTEEYSQDEKIEFFTFLFQHEPWSKLSAKEKNNTLSAPGGYTRSCAVSKHTSIFIINHFGEKFSEAENAILKRFGKVFDQTYTRFLDLQKAEAQAREAEIQLALERVRARSLAMHRSEELADISLELVKQVQTLGMESWFCAFNIYDDDPKGSVEWGSNGQGTFPQYRTPREGVFLRYFEAGQRGETLLVNEIGEEECTAHYEYLCSLPGVGEQLLQMKAAGIPFPSSQIDHVAFFKYGYVLFITYEPAYESHDIFKRFAKVFEQTYTRFLDIQKAEEQAREAQIENALEKVRSRTMAMQRSDELTDVAGLLFNQVSALGIKTWTAGFNVWSEDNNSYVDYLSLNGEIFGPNTVHTEKAEALKDLSNARKSGVEFDVLYVEGEKIKELYLAISGIDEKEYDRMVKDGLLPSQQYEHFVFGAKVSVMFITYEPVPEAHDIFKRLGKVFEQTYTRFLDLQKAEAQAKEAKIETALEKVRSRTMGMQSSEELPEVANLLFTEVRALGIHAWSCGYNILAEDKKSATCCMSSEGTLQTPFQLRLWGENSFEEMGEFVLNDHAMLVQELGGTALEEHYVHMKSFPDLKPTFDEIDRLGLSLPTYQINHLCKFNGGFILFITYEKVPESHAIFKRFTNVFDQTYTRFLDLKKAEAQAREAQIENALEKVRSRSLAMQNPDELIEVAQLLREEMGALGVEELETSSIYIHDNDSNTTQCWFTIKNSQNPGKAITDQMTLNLRDTWVGRKMLDFYHSPSNQTSILMQGEQRIEWIRYCEGKSELFGSSNFYGEIIPDRTYHLYKFSNGYIGAAAPGEISSESWELLKRATAVFSFAYTRFGDLQMAEASARAVMRQASLDRVRAEISSMRHADDLDRITPLFFQELTTLGIPFIRCGVFIIQEKQEIVEAYLSSPDGNSLGVLRLPYQASELTYNTVEAWRKGSVYRQHWNKEDFVNWINQLMEQDQIQDSSTYQGTAAPPESLDLHFVPFTQGMLYVGAEKTLDEKELELVQALAKAFSIAYARYEDFIKLEHAKVEIESAMIELKATQSQLVQQEKLASLGQLTAGIAHEIKNPLNFVNNFSEVSIELVDEAIEERSKGPEARDESLVDEILIDIKSNLQKVHEHGSRANGIVTSMLQHSRGGSGKLDPTDLNALVKEYVNLSFHGMRAGKNPIDVEIAFDLDPEIKDVPLIKEDFIRVIINLCNNAFDAMRGKMYQVQSTKYEVEVGKDIDYLPKLAVSTILENGRVRISLADNGPGIPDEIKDKILQPFFTTKKGTEGTGLGLSITHDIVKAHGGELEIETSINKGTTFIIKLSR